MFAGADFDQVVHGVAGEDLASIDQFIFRSRSRCRCRGWSRCGLNFRFCSAVILSYRVAGLSVVVDSDPSVVHAVLCHSAGHGDLVSEMESAQQRVICGEAAADIHAVLFGAVADFVQLPDCVGRSGLFRFFDRVVLQNLEAADRIFDRGCFVLLGNASCDHEDFVRSGVEHLIDFRIFFICQFCLRELGSVHDVVDRDQVIAVADGEPGIRVIDDCPVIIIFRRLDG